MSTPADAYRASSAPLSADCLHQVFELDTSPDSITLLTGTYEVLNVGSELAFVRVGAAVSIPADKAAGTAGQAPIPAGGLLTFYVEEGALHGQVATGTTTLHIVRKGA